MVTGDTEAGSPIRSAFLQQAWSCDKLGSPFTAQLLRLLADRLDDSTAVGRTLLHWRGDPIADALALRLSAAFHALVLTERSGDLINVYPPVLHVEDDGLWQAVTRAIHGHAEFICRFIENPPQTNEVARSAALAGGFLTIAACTSLPLYILELGSSAGLNLHWDSYSYDLGGVKVGGDDQKPRLAPSWMGPGPPASDVHIRARAGCDQEPIDARSSEQALRLRAYVWPDQQDRHTRLTDALAVAAASPHRVERADAAEWTRRNLAQQRPDTATVLFHSIVWQYLGKQRQHDLQQLIEAAGRRSSATSPFAWLRMEPETDKAAALRLTLWPHGQTRHLADVDYHGRWIRWHIEAEALIAAFAIN